MKSDTYLTPPEIVRALGSFDLDPCCPPAMPWRTAKCMICPPENGLSIKWHGRVWLNPPFGNKAAAWLEKLAGHGIGTALIPARTETRMFYNSVWPLATAVLFMRGRPHFHYADGTRAAANSGAPIALVAYGDADADALFRSGLGVCIDTSPRWLERVAVALERSGQISLSARAVRNAIGLNPALEHPPRLGGGSVAPGCSVSESRRDNE